MTCTLSFSNGIDVRKKITIFDVATKCKPKAYFVSSPNKKENVRALGLEWDEFFN
jgi:hypothetical protein